MTKMSVPVTTTKYTGPTKPFGQDTVPNDFVTQISSADLLITDATGTFSGAYFTSGVTTSAEFIALAGIYGEYRVLSMELKYLPNFGPGYNTSVIPPIGAVATRHSSSLVTPANFQSVIESPTFKPWGASRPLTMRWRMNGIDEAGFQPTSGAVSTGGLLLACTGGTASSSFGRFYITFLVQFKGRQ